MKWIFFVFILGVFLNAQNAEAFKGSRCAKVFPGKNKGLGKVEKVYYALFSVSTSVSQFLTSTGDCRMLGGISVDERKFFVAENAYHLRGDIVRAEGDYLMAMTFLYGCDAQRLDRVFLRLQQNVTKVFGQDLRNSAVKVADEIDILMESDISLKKLCSLSA